MGSTRDTLKRRVRKTVKWGGAGLSVVLLVVWIASARWKVEWTSEGTIRVAIAYGSCIVADYDRQREVFAQMKAMGLAHTWEVVAVDGPFHWWFHALTAPGVRVVHLPLWLPCLLSLLATAAAWRADAKYLRRVREGGCPACGYDRAGLAAGSLCPECGKQPEER